MTSEYTTFRCYFCGEETKHKILKCERSIASRLLRGVVTMGISEAFGNTYQCKCAKCGHINELLM